MKFLKHLARLPLHFVLFLFYFLSYLFPRSEKIWVFGCWDGKRFADNSKHFFLYVAQEKKEVKSIWISRDKNIVSNLKKRGYASYYHLSILGMYYSLRAKVYIFDSYINGINFWLSGGARKINLWHGIPIKKIEADIDNKKSIIYNLKGFIGFFSTLLFPWIYVNRRLDLLFTTSTLFQEIFSSAFNLPKEKIKISGYSRNDVFFRKVKHSIGPKEEKIFKQIKKRKSNGHKIIFYIPTFRDSGGNPIIDGGIDLSELNIFLEKHKAQFFIKFHSVSKININKNHSNINFLPSELDIYPVLNNVDILITDYSSVYFDFLLLDKPIIFFPYDLEKYTTKDRGFYFDYEEFTPGPKSYHFDQLLKTTESILKGNDDYVEAKAKIKNLCFQYQTDNSSERIYSDILEVVGVNP